MTRDRYRIFEDGFPYFLTDTIVAWLGVFSRPELVEIIFDSWRFLQRERAVTIYGYVIMENHLHWIAAGDELAEKVGRFKSYTAGRIIDELQDRGFKTMLDELRYDKLRHKIDQKYQLWQKGSHPKQMESGSMMIQKLEYMHANPVRRGYVDDPVHWRYTVLPLSINDLCQVDNHLTTVWWFGILNKSNEPDKCLRHSPGSVHQSPLNEKGTSDGCHQV